MITDQMKEKLIAHGLSKQQVTSATAEAVINALMNDDEKTLIQEAKNQVTEMEKLINSLRYEYIELKNKIDNMAGILTDILKVQEEYGATTDEKAKNAIALYATLIKINERVGGKDSDIINNAGYVTYAYLSGQARRDINYIYTKDNEE